MRGTAYIVSLLVVLGWAAPALACDERSWTGGTTEWCGGAFVYRDYVYDDDGADRMPGWSPHGPSLGAATGDVDHRDHGQSLNSADLLTLRLRAKGNDLAARFELNTLLPGDATIAAVAVDTDDNPLTGGGAWPGLTGVASKGWEHVYVLKTRDADANVIEGRLPLPPGRFRVQALVALGDGTPMNVAFRPHDHGNWWEDDQAAALEAGDISAFGAEVSATDLRRGLDRPAALEPGYHERIYTSDYPIREGVDYDGVEGSTPAPYGIHVQGSTATFQYLGTHQPYAIYVPKGPAPHGAELLLHGLNAIHSGVINQPGMQQVIGEDQNRIIVSPLGRGAANFYIDWGARDVLDALADVEHHYSVDPDQVVLSGYSMGGLGTMQLATWFPDRFAAGIGWVPFTGNCLNGTPLAQGRQRPAELSALSPANPYFTNSDDARWGCDMGTRGNALDYLENTRHLPVAYLFATEDELVWPNHALGLMRREEELGYVHRFWLHLTGEHLTLALADDWRKEATWSHGARLVHHPARVTYRTNSYLWVPKLDLVPDGAYWIDEMRPRHDEHTPDGDMQADLISHACPADSEPTVETRRDAGTDPVPWIGEEGARTGTETLEPGARITGTLTNVASLLIDVEGACLQPGAPIALDIKTDGPTTVRFSDGRPPEAIG